MRLNFLSILAVDPTTNPNSQNINGWGLKVVDYFEPYNALALYQADLDTASAGPILVTDPAALGGLYSQVLITSAKSGTIYVIDTNNMGKFNPNGNVIIQTLSSVGYLNGSIKSIFSSPSYFDNTVFFAGPGSTGQSFAMADGVLSKLGNTSLSYGYPGAIPTVSSLGNANGIIWTTDSATQALYAYPADNVAYTLWSSNEAPAERDILDSYQKFAVPVVNNGMVYQGTGNSIIAYGLLPPPPPPQNQPVTILYRGQSISTGNGYTLTLQAYDGNLVVYGPGGAAWSTVTGPIAYPGYNPTAKAKKGSCASYWHYGASAVGDVAVMQGDGNYVLYRIGASNNLIATWATQTTGHAGAQTRLQTDGNLVTYAPNGKGLWSWLTGCLE